MQLHISKHRMRAQIGVYQALDPDKRLCWETEMMHTSPVLTSTSAEEIFTASEPSRVSA